MRKSWLTYKAIIINILLSIVVFGVIVFVSFRQTKRANITASKVSNTLNVLFHKEKLVSSTTDNETSSRAYLLTEEPQFLSTYQRSKQNIPGQIQQLRKLTSGNPVQRKSMDSLAEFLAKRIYFTDSVLGLKDSLGSQAAVKMLITGRGKLYMDHIRRLLDQLHSAENKIYEQSIRENLEEIDRQNKVFLFIVFMIITALTFFSWREKRRVAMEERKRSEVISKSEKRFRALVENNESIIALMNDKFETVYRSPASERITGWSPVDRDSVGTTALNHPDDAAAAEHAIKQVMAHPGKAVPLRLRTRHKNGEWIRLEGVMRNMFHDPAVNGIIVNLIDVTESKKAEEEITKLNLQLEEKVNLRTQQLQTANSDMEAFTYSVSHDLRAPLRIINGFTTILEEDYADKLDAEAKRLTGVIKKNTAKMGALIDGLLDFSRMRLQELDRSMINTDQLVADVVASLQTDQNKNISWTISPLPEIWGDMNAIRQVWINLVANAMKYSRKRDNPQIEIGAFIKEGKTVFFVKDNGVGFDANYSDKLFKVFQRLHSAEEFEGTGIGLAVVHKVVTKHGGSVWASGEPGKGASFYFSLPAA